MKSLFIERNEKLKKDWNFVNDIENFLCKIHFLEISLFAFNITLSLLCKIWLFFILIFAWLTFYSISSLHENKHSFMHNPHCESKTNDKVIADCKLVKRIIPLMEKWIFVVGIGKNSKKAFWYHYFSETKLEISIEDGIDFTKSEESILLCLLNII